jgi:hypothetical protein
VEGKKNEKEKSTMREIGKTSGPFRNLFFNSASDR